MRLSQEEWNSILQRIESDDPSLTSLDLWESGIEDEEVRVLAEVLKVNSSLKKLYLGNNSRISDKGVMALAEALKVNNSLEELVLGDHDFVTDIGVGQLAEALKINKSLTTLVVRGVELENPGAIALAEALEINSALKILDLSCNCIEDEGLMRLSEMLTKNNSLQDLSLERNPIGDEGVKSLAEALKINNSLTHLDISDNERDDEIVEDAWFENAGVGEEGVRELVRVFETNISLTDLRQDFEVFNQSIAEFTIRNKTFPKLIADKFIQKVKTLAEEINFSPEENNFCSLVFQNPNASAKILDLVCDKFLDQDGDLLQELSKIPQWRRIMVSDAFASEKKYQLNQATLKDLFEVAGIMKDSFKLSSGGASEPQVVDQESAMGKVFNSTDILSVIAGYLAENKLPVSIKKQNPPSYPNMLGSSSEAFVGDRSQSAAVDNTSEEGAGAIDEDADLRNFLFEEFLSEGSESERAPTPDVKKPDAKKAKLNSEQDRGNEGL